MTVDAMVSPPPVAGDAIPEMTAPPGALRATVVARLLAGPPPAAGAEGIAAHRARLGALPPHDAVALLAMLDESGLHGRGGAAFPAGAKWRAVAQRSQGGAVVAINAAEGEPGSRKDQLLLVARPHLVLDGAALAARAVRAREIVVYVNEGYPDACATLAAAWEERSEAERGVALRVVRAPQRYVAGEETAMIRRIDGGPALPRPVPPRPFEHGVQGRPTLVQNVETLAHIALLARHGAGWFREVGTEDAVGSTLVSISVLGSEPRVLEVALGAPVAEVVRAAGHDPGSVAALLAGGCFGGFVPARVALRAELTEASLARLGASLGSGVIALVPREACGLAETARLVRYLAGESAGQCGPCVHGLGAIAEAMEGLVRGRRQHHTEVQRIRRWAGQVIGRGACHHPDGVARLALSGLATFTDELAAHARGGCAVSRG